MFRGAGGGLFCLWGWNHVGHANVSAPQVPDSGKRYYGTGVVVTSRSGKNRTLRRFVAFWGFWAGSCPRNVATGISFIALRRLQVYIRLPQSSPPSTVFLPEGPTGSQPPFYESQKLIAWASRTSFFRYLSIPVGYRNHFLGCRRLGYPEGSDSPSIRPSMLANSRRLRWLSANNNQ